MKRMHLFLLAVMVVALTAAAMPTVADAGDYLVISKSGKQPKGLVGKVAAAGGTVTSTIDAVGIAVASSTDPGFKAKAAGIAGVRAVVPNLVVNWLPGEEVVTGEDFYNPPNSGDDDFFFDLQWGHDAVDAPEAWNAGYRGAGAVVAVLDGGFDSYHPDLKPNIMETVSFVPDEDPEYALPDVFSHGSHTAGTVAAADNGFGTIGVAPEAELMLVKVLSDNGSGAFSWIIEGIIYAADNGADVISMSFGAYLEKSGFCNEEVCFTAREANELKNAIARATTYAYQKGVTVVASAGNDAIDFDHTADLIHVPSDAPHVICVSASAPVGWATGMDPFLDYPASYTNYGQSTIDFAAPGGDYVYPDYENICVVGGLVNYCFVFDYVFSTGNNGWYWSIGTSMAVPYVSGVAAIIIGMNGSEMTPAQVEAALRKSADDLGKPGKDDFYGHGRVNAANAVD